MNDISISVVVPVYCGANYLPDLVEKLASVRNQWAEQKHALSLMEAIFVNDAAIDNSSQVLAELEKNHSWIKIISLSKNFGQHPATVAGLLYTSGDWVVTMDEDLQHRPENIIELLQVVAETGADIVYAKPVSSVHRNGHRDLAARTYKSILALLTGNRVIKYFNSFRLLRGSIARSAASVCGYDTYIDIALNWFTDRVETKTLELKDIRHIQTGRSGYNLYRLFSHARRLVTSSQTKVLRFGAAIGVIAMFVAILLSLNVIIEYIFYPGTIEVRGWSSLFIGILFFGGISAFLLGIILEYLTNMVLHSQGKPVFFAVDRTKDIILKSIFDKK